MNRETVEVEIDLDEHVSRSVELWAKYHDVDFDKIIDDALSQWLITEEMTVIRAGGKPPVKMQGQLGQREYTRYIDLD